MASNMQILFIRNHGCNRGRVIVIMIGISLATQIKCSKSVVHSQNKPMFVYLKVHSINKEHEVMHYNNNTNRCLARTK